jgi:flavin reductase (DIM6/NTAB) family NADH-FMN oxidoreductase RutF
MKTYTKKSLPLDKIRKLLEPGPIVLVSSAYKDKQNIMTMGWYTVMEFTPSLVGCIIASDNHSYEMIRKSKECVINIPATDMAKQVAGIDNCSGNDTDKFEAFGLTAIKAKEVNAPLVKECYANFECRLYDKKLVDTYNFFIFEVVRAISAASPKYPETIHYTGDGIFMRSGDHINLKKMFRKENL